MTAQQKDRVRALNTEAALAFEELSLLDPWQHQKRLELLDRYETALQEALQILKDNY